MHIIRTQGPGLKRHLWVSDLHLDHPGFQADLFHRDMTAACEANATISIVGDIIDVMQGRSDPRSSKGSLLEKLNRPDYFDGVVELAVATLAPYAKNIAIISDGNHETSVLKRQEIDLVRHICRGLEPHGFLGKRGWYRGFVVFQQVCADNWMAPTNSTARASAKVLFHHGGGGSARRTKGVLDTMAGIDFAEGIDAYVAGHQHTRNMIDHQRHTLDSKYNPRIRSIQGVRCGTYKEDDGAGGWGVEKNLGPPSLGGQMMSYRAVHRAGGPMVMEISFTGTATQSIR